MSKQNGPMDKTVVSLMCENIKKLPVDINEMVRTDPERAVRFIHGQYLDAKSELSLKLSQELESQS